MGDIDVLLSRLVNINCWLVIAGPGSGSVVELGFGGRVQRKRRLNNPTLSVEEREFEPVNSLLISCAWRLSENGAAICGWRDDNEIGGKMLRGLNRLRGTTISCASKVSDLNDIRLEFGSGLVLDIFCDQTNPDEADYDYLLFMGRDVITVKGGVFVTEQR